MVIGAVLVSVSCQEGRHGQCRCNALTCGCDCHTTIRASNGTCAPYRPTVADRTELIAMASPPVNGPEVRTKSVDQNAVELPPNFELRPSNRVPCEFGCGGEYPSGAGMAAHVRACVKNPDRNPRPKKLKPSPKLDLAERAHRAAVERLNGNTGPARSVRQMSRQERADALVFLEALVEERHTVGVEEGAGAVWNVVAPSGLQDQVTAAADAVMAEHPELGGLAMSELIAERVPGARVGPGARDEPAPTADPEVPALEPMASDDVAQHDIELNLSREDLTFLQYLVDSSNVFESINDIARQFIVSGIDMAHDELAFPTKYALRYIGGLTPEESDEVDDAERRV